MKNIEIQRKAGGGGTNQCKPHIRNQEKELDTTQSWEAKCHTRNVHRFECAGVRHSCIVKQMKYTCVLIYYIIYIYVYILSIAI